jgi:hypothetical protein
MTDEPLWPIGTYVRKKSGSEWHGKIVGHYSTDLNPRGYAVESLLERHNVQVYPEKALEPTTLGEIAAAAQRAADRLYAEWKPQP